MISNFEWSLKMNSLQDGHPFSMDIIDLNLASLCHHNKDIPNTTKFSFNEILCSSNVFEMGCKGQPQSPHHLVEIGHDYLISDILITHSIWNDICGQNEHRKTKEYNSNLPMQRVNWFEVALFCNLLSRQAKLPSCYEFVQGTIFFDGTKKGYRMPFEVEWENSAKANSNYVYSGSDEYNDVASFKTKDSYLTPIKMKNPNAWGIYDMTGNVNEWCNDVFDENAYYKRMKIGKTAYFDINEQHFELDIQRDNLTQMVVRGGSWFNTPNHSKVYTRHYQNALLSSAMVGIRVVRTI